MTKQEILDELERIKDGLQDSDGMGRFGVDGACDDLDDLMFEINVNTEDFWNLGEINDGLDIYNTMYNISVVLG